MILNCVFIIVILSISSFSQHWSTTIIANAHVTSCNAKPHTVEWISFSIIFIRLFYIMIIIIASPHLFTRFFLARKFRFWSNILRINWGQGSSGHYILKLFNMSLRWRQDHLSLIFDWHRLIFKLLDHLSYHASKIGVGVQSGKMLLIATMKWRWRQVHFAHEVVIEIFVIPNGIVFFGSVHHLRKTFPNKKPYVSKSHNILYLASARNHIFRCSRSFRCRRRRCGRCCWRSSWRSCWLQFWHGCSK